MKQESYGRWSDRLLKKQIKSGERKLKENPNREDADKIKLHVDLCREEIKNRADKRG